MTMAKLYELGIISWLYCGIRNGSQNYEENCNRVYGSLSRRMSLIWYQVIFEFIMSMRPEGNMINILSSMFIYTSLKTGT